MKLRIFAPALLLVALVLLTSCSRDYVTGRPSFNLVSEETEVELGQEYDLQIQEEYGVYDDAALAEYVEGLGLRIAATSQRANLPYTFRVLDSPVINAFALPGGYIYVTRGIIVHLDSEDALVGVVGHEVGHVVARHSAKLMSRQALTSPLAKIPLVGGIIYAPFRLNQLRYGRSQENQSDELGVEYGTKLGYDASQVANFFDLLKRMDEKDGQNVPTFQSTHPDPGDRSENVRKLTKKMQREIDYRPQNLDRNDFLRRLDGVVYGPNPRHGFVDGGVFYHPDLAFQFPVPEDWEVQNSAASVFMMTEDQQALIIFGLWEGAGPEAAAAEFKKEMGVPVLREEAGQVNGMPAYVVEIAYADKKSSVHYLSYFIEMGDVVYVFHGMTSEALYRDQLINFITTMEGFDTLTDPTILALQPRRVRVVEAPRDGKLLDNLRALGATNSELETLSELNGRLLEATVHRGELIKIVK